MPGKKENTIRAELSNKEGIHSDKIVPIPIESKKEDIINLVGGFYDTLLRDGLEIKNFELELINNGLENSLYEGIKGNILNKLKVYSSQHN